MSIKAELALESGNCLRPSEHENTTKVNWYEPYTIEDCGLFTSHYRIVREISIYIKADLVIYGYSIDSYMRRWWFMP